MKTRNGQSSTGRASKREVVREKKLLLGEFETDTTGRREKFAELSRLDE